MLNLTRFLLCFIFLFLALKKLLKWSFLWKYTSRFTSLNSFLLLLKEITIIYHFLIFTYSLSIISYLVHKSISLFLSLLFSRTKNILENKNKKNLNGWMVNGLSLGFFLFVFFKLTMGNSIIDPNTLIV